MTALARVRLLALALPLVLPLAARVAFAQSSPPIARLRIAPAVRSVAAGDSLQLVTEALDAQGNVVPGVRMGYRAEGGWFQGDMSETGMVIEGTSVVRKS